MAREYKICALFYMFYLDYNHVGALIDIILLSLTQEKCESVRQMPRTFIHRDSWTLSHAFHYNPCTEKLGVSLIKVKCNVSPVNGTFVWKAWHACVLRHQGQVCWREDPNSGGGSGRMHQTAAHHLLWCQRSSRWGAANKTNKQNKTLLCAICLSHLLV